MVISWMAVARGVDIVHIWAANTEVDYVDACLKEKKLIRCQIVLQPPWVEIS